MLPKKSTLNLLAVPFFAYCTTVYAQELDELVENQLMDRLMQVQNDPQTETIQPFTTDGCSGGLSGSWQYIAQLFPRVKEQFGESPIWEPCCFAHDVAYWRGETVDGYQKRVVADEALRQCVVESGNAWRDQLSERLSVSPTEIEQAVTTIADVMYLAIRVGGGPCTVFPWRWGYGWPSCTSIYTSK